ncbi:MAG: hypothetical protein ABIJ45_06790 [Candidatus Zixiibacteriota bacterium]
MKKKILIFVLIAIGFMIVSAQDKGSQDTIMADTASINVKNQISSSLVYILDISGGIGTVTADRVIEAVDLAEFERASLLLVIMDTPGGLMISEWDITKAIMNSTVPVAVFVYPVGANSGSAGVFISYSAHISAMAPNTRIGAAHSVSGAGEQMDSVMSERFKTMLSLQYGRWRLAMVVMPSGPRRRYENRPQSQAMKLSN